MFYAFDSLSPKLAILGAAFTVVIAAATGCNPSPVGSVPVNSAAPLPLPLPPPPPPPPPPGSSGAIGSSAGGTSQGWQEHVSAQDRFKVNFPRGQVSSSTEQDQGPTGPIPRFGTFVDLGTQGGGYFVWCNKNPDQIAQPDEACKLMANAAANAVANAMGGQVASSTERPVSNRVGMYYVVTGKNQGLDIKQHILYVVTSDRFYQVMCIGLGNAQSQGDVDRFIGSFAILE